MRLARALELTHNFVSTPNSLEGLDSLLDPSLVEQALEQAGVATLRKRRLPLEMMLWCVISMAFFRRMSAWDVVSRMSIMLPGQRPLVAPSAVVQARQRLGSEAVRQVFDLTQKSWHEAAGHPTWAGLRLLGVDGVVWRTPDTPENRARYDSSNYTLRSKTPEMIEQELWGVLLGYNLLRYQMVEMSRHCPGIHPCELSFTACTWAILGFINGVSADRSGNIPKYLAELHASAPHYFLPHRREERIYPRAIRLKSPKYPVKNKNASQLN